MLTEESIKSFEEKIGYCFTDKALLKQALTHSSFVNEQRINKLPDYERLEFLGDAVLQLTTSDFLFREYADVREGELTRRRASLVCGATLARCARKIGISAYLLMGKGEEATGGRDKDHILADAMEAVIGAVYLDGGFKQAEAFIHRFVLTDLGEESFIYDSKTLFQEYVQKEKGAALSYVLVDEHGPDHNREFIVEVRVNGEARGKGVGRTKKAAEQQAAYEALMAAKGQEKNVQE